MRGRLQALFATSAVQRVSGAARVDADLTVFEMCNVSELLGSALGLVAAAARPRSLPPLAQWALAGAVLALVIGAWLRALS